jgi:NADH-quinone oxidoreductase subunit H
MIVFSIFIKIIGIIVPLLVCVAFFTVAERKIIGSIQRRRGPNVVGVFGILQAIADGLKLLLKESIVPSSSSKFLFIFAPMLTLFLSLVGWVVIPFNLGGVFSDMNLSLLFLFAISSLGVYGIIIAGWSSNSKYAFLGALRSAAQIISYEVSMGFIIVSVILCSGSLNLSNIVLAQKNIWYFIPLFPIFILFFISSIAETNRHPFDLPEAEAELVSGYNVEYSAIGFALFFLGEYGNIILISGLNVLLFFGGWLSPLPFFIKDSSFFFAIKTFFFLLLFIWARAAFPRYRYDQLIRLGWKVFLPCSIGWVVLTSGVLLGFNWLP